jgi:L-rhamnose mutarotase
MKNSIHTLPLLILLVLPLALTGFSSYENYLNTDQPTQVGLLAKIDPSKEEDIRASLLRLSDPDETKQLARAGIQNVTAFTRIINETSWLVVHFVQDDEKPYLEAASLFENASVGTRNLTKQILPHPLAKRFGAKWLQMEWINYIRGKDIDGPQKSELMIVTTILPEKESEYRSLHQTVWPGVVDQLVRSWNRDLCIFLAEIDGLLVEFLYVEYVGDTREAHDAMSQSNPINHRWWKLTDACQKGLPGVDGNWIPMDQVKK